MSDDEIPPLSFSFPCEWGCKDIFYYNSVTQVKLLGPDRKWLHSKHYQQDKTNETEQNVIFKWNANKRLLTLISSLVIGAIPLSFWALHFLSAAAAKSGNSSSSWVNESKLYYTHTPSLEIYLLPITLDWVFKCDIWILLFYYLKKL